MSKYSEYHEAICQAMFKLNKIDNTIFLGQQVRITDFYNTLSSIPMHKRLEMPVAEELQLGMSIGLSLEGFLPISIFQRIDFLPRCCDQLVNHLDLIKPLSENKFNPKVIIRTTIGSTKPLYTGLQHSKDLTKGFQALLNFPVIAVKTVKEVHDSYNEAINCKTPIMIIEFQDLFNK